MCSQDTNIENVLKIHTQSDKDRLAKINDFIRENLKGNDRVVTLIKAHKFIHKPSLTR